MSFEEAEATLLVDVEEGAVGLATEIFKDCGARKVRLARDEEEADTFYQARSMAYLAVKSLASGVQVEDVAVPIDRLGEYLRFVKEVASKYGIRIPVNGHAGDGNVHPSYSTTRPTQKSRATANLAYEELCRKAIAMGGSVTGEHGVGVQKTRFLGSSSSPTRAGGAQADEGDQEDLRPRGHHESREVCRGGVRESRWALPEAKMALQGGTLPLLVHDRLQDGRRTVWERRQEQPRAQASEERSRKGDLDNLLPHRGREEC